MTTTKCSTCGVDTRGRIGSDGKCYSHTYDHLQWWKGGKWRRETDTERNRRVGR